MPTLRRKQNGRVVVATRNDDAFETTRYSLDLDDDDDNRNWFRYDVDLGAWVFLPDGPYTTVDREATVTHAVRDEWATEGWVPAWCWEMLDELRGAVGIKCSRETAERKLAMYDARREGGYKNQVIAARDDVKRTTGLGVRELRRYLAVS